MDFRFCYESLFSSFIHLEAKQTNKQTYKKNKTPWANLTQIITLLSCSMQKRTFSASLTCAIMKASREGGVQERKRSDAL